MHAGLADVMQAGRRMSCMLGGRCHARQCADVGPLLLPLRLPLLLLLRRPLLIVCLLLLGLALLLFLV